MPADRRAPDAEPDFPCDAKGDASLNPLGALEGGEEEAELILRLVRRHPEVFSIASLGLESLEEARSYGMVPLGLPLPPGRRGWVTEESRRDVIVASVLMEAAAHRRRATLLTQARGALADSDASLSAAEAKDKVRARLHGFLSLPDFPAPLRLEAMRLMDADALQGLDDTALRQHIVDDPPLRQALDRGLAEVAAHYRTLRGQAPDEGDSWTFENLAQRLYRASRGNAQPNDIIRRWSETTEQWLKERLVSRGRGFVDSEFDFARFERLFPLARSMQRRLVLIIGPTNSGKTHRALTALRAAQTGVYLAPLRLLALEAMDRLNRDGVPTSLLTGEEEIAVPDARHVASTIEMMDPDRPVDAVVIDEIQMLADPDRGWAWTAALMGAPGQTVYMLGAPDVRPLIERAAAHLGEPLEIVTLERKAPLLMLDRRLEMSDLEAGDALIAFSRRSVHQARDAAQAQGARVAMIYGALAHEVRRREAERFSSGEASVVAATDAIGMGLNLPIRRVLFTSLEKFDGKRTRPLSAAEIKQIAGRAGRFGRHESGFFGVIGKGTPALLQRLLNQPTRDFGPRAVLTVRPARMMLERLAHRLNADRLLPLVDCFAAAKTLGSPYRVADLGDLRRLAQRLDEEPIGFGARLALLFMPIDLDRETDFAFLKRILFAISTQKPLPLAAVTPATAQRLDDEGLEELSRLCDLYYWVGRKFPALFPDRDGATSLRAEVAERLADLLANPLRRPARGRNGSGKRKAAAGKTKPQSAQPTHRPPTRRGPPRKAGR
jgi:ATP-dependent RNA helicase SUPV3L1/SUV3